jgi:hypothetical protein
MTWNGEERRTGQERRVVERRRMSRYDIALLVILDGITWIDERGAERRKYIRRREDRERLAQKFLQISRPG